MSHAPDYTPSVSFADDEQNQAAGRSTVRTEPLDTQLANIAASINALNDNLKLLQRDDDKLRDLLVEPYALSEQTRALMAAGGRPPRGPWAPDTLYDLGDLVQRNAVAYMALADHNSGPTFNLGFWMAISGDGSAQAWAEVALDAQTAAEAAAATATTEADAATAAAAAAALSQTAAAASALAAQNAADSIAGLSPVSLSAYMLEFLANNNAANARATLGALASTFATDLASTASAPVGTGMVAEPRLNFNYAVATLGEWLNDLPSFMSLVPSAERAAIRARTSTYDLASTLDAALALGITKMRFPEGKYYFSGNVTASWSGTPVRLVGEGAAYAVNTGTVFEFAGSGAFIEYDGVATHDAFLFKDIRVTYTGSSVAYGLKLYRCYNVDLEGAQFHGFNVTSGASGGSYSAGVWCTGATGGQSLLTRVNNSYFTDCYDGLYFDKTDAMVLSVKGSWFYDNAGNGIRLGDRTGLNSASCQAWVIEGCTFEANVGADIEAIGGVQGMKIGGGTYFEWSSTKTPIVFGSIGGVTPINAGIEIDSSVTFNGDPGSGNGMIHVSDIDGLTVTHPFIANNVGATRYLVKNTKSGGVFANVLVRSGAKPSGNTQLPAVYDTTTSLTTANEYRSAQNGTSWTPGVAFGGASVGVTYSVQAGSYVKVGQLVTAFFRIVLTSKGSSTGTLTITGLPFPIANTAAAFGGAGGMSSYNSLASLAGGVVPFVGAINVSVFNILQQGAANSNSLTDANLTNTSTMQGQLTYLAAA
jgi:hypothetical protein